MQIVKGDHNSQLKKDEETHLRKMNSQGSMARKIKTTHSPVRPFDGEELWVIPWPVYTVWVSVRGPMQQLVERDGKRRDQ